MCISFRKYHHGASTIVATFMTKRGFAIYCYSSIDELGIAID